MFFDRRSLEKVGRRSIVRGKQGRPFAAERRIVAARPRDEFIAVIAGVNERALQDLIDGAPSLGCHRRSGPGHGSSSRRNHARAMAHWRPAVAGEMPSASAASVILSPAK